jgi:hypothetical protein
MIGQKPDIKAAVSARSKQAVRPLFSGMRSV